MASVEPNVEPGQIWEDCDKRNPGRRVKVLRVYVHNKYKVADCEILTNGGRPSDFASPEQTGTGFVGRTTRIRISRMRPGSTGYRLVPQNLPQVFDQILRRL